MHVVRTDDEAGVRAAVAHLVELGHRDIVHVDGGRAPGAAERRRGYRAAMHGHGLAAHGRIRPGGLTEELGAAAARILLDGPLPTAVVAFNDRCAVGILDTLTRNGVAVPGDVSLVGYDDDRLSRLPHVNLTTVAQNAVRIAALAVDTAVARLAGAPRPRETVVAPRLAVRATTAAPSGRRGPRRREPVKR